MRHRRGRSLTGALLVALAPWAPAVADDVVVERALRDELDRSMQELHVEGLVRPYFIAYRVDDVRVVAHEATLGSLVRSEVQRNRTLHVELRVGSYEYDNSNFFSLPSGTSSQIFLAGEIPLPLEDDYQEIRRQAWLATDVAYKNALETFAKKEAALRNRKRRGDLPDFARAEVRRTTAAAPLPPVDVAASRELTRELSEALRGMNHVHQSRVSHQITARQTLFLNSEGTSYTRTVADLVVWAYALTQAEDGMMLEDSLTIFGRSREDLPPAGELAAEIARLGDHLRLLPQAERLERYNGPVLFEPRAAAEFLAQSFVPKLLAQRQPFAAAQHMDLLPGGEQDFKQRLGGRVLPRFLSLVDDPTAREHAGRRLFGGFAVDDEGVVARPTRLVASGFLKTLLCGRTPIPGVERSTGSFRAGGVVPSNLILTVERNASTPAELRRKLLALVAERGGEFGIVVRRMGNPFFSAPENPSNRRLFGNQDKTDAGPILAAYKVYPDGREVLLRRVVVTNVDAQAFREILAAGNERRVVHRPFRPAGGNRFGFGAASSDIPLISLVTPALLFEELTVSEAGGENLQPMVVKPPRQGAGEKTSPGVFFRPPR